MLFVQISTIQLLVHGYCWLVSNTLDTWACFSQVMYSNINELQHGRRARVTACVIVLYIISREGEGRGEGE